MGFNTKNLVGSFRWMTIFRFVSDWTTAAVHCVLFAVLYLRCSRWDRWMALDC